ncbi:DUF4810 domain-containing protein [Saccharospirillum mangrovi]|uniref:DUF4810 domain-containing protein n=1 Tax=Saccharospirillum mangrovi TaxID=2161747 RepID=UPI000D3BB5FD|nr:DUF4810 domain-containing protein [Saccharospirillum mangrovi]
MRIGLLLVAPALLLGGCASTQLYNWGNYEEDLFTYYNEPGEQAEVVADHVAFLDKIMARGEKPAPGLLAEAGTFYLQAGNTDKALEYYQLEYDTWPESRALMSSLINNLGGAQ